ncbi:hypothetical protein E2C01_017935 [Portunus trituberculatus]|uniref:Uncharacterized protein n=1 Tax=Portunus trituberculatus TaxID=210409 RepID=A0A5B7DT83_PORTR|nr:hypothetical protein [Portunus trituberculatus]
MGGAVLLPTTTTHRRGEIAVYLHFDVTWLMVSDEAPRGPVALRMLQSGRPPGTKKSLQTTAEEDKEMEETVQARWRLLFFNFPA